MNSPSYDVYESYARERNARILKASDDAQCLRSLSKKAKAEQKDPSRKGSPLRLLGALADLIQVRKQQPA